VEFVEEEARFAEVVFFEGEFLGGMSDVEVERVPSFEELVVCFCVLEAFFSEEAVPFFLEFLERKTGR